jgi:hypothetical protein
MPQVGRFKNLAIIGVFIWRIDHFFQGECSVSLPAEIGSIILDRFSAWTYR